ncbi:hypothetical protein TrLO_g7735 [Triparma laevis f. longispina]|uniref:protein-histidine N-methyltransferase n=1 Tax=Triparma laevis f. longispina TaxID=1714387 RepID=A0A9W7AWD1_9STRA|nr:hypothetical protein TrLO_g7735 [Triparma laevis f. longispina]
MSTFAFNFLDSDSTEKDTSTLPTPTTPIVPPVLYSPPTNPLNYPSTPLLAYPSISLTHSSTISSLPSTHDLVPGFEGGHKTWESSVDLLDVLGDCKGGTILELGCGTSLPTLYLLQKNPTSTATVIDYNLPVIQTTTFPNFHTNRLSSHVKFYSGDWNGLTDVGVGEFDVVIASETVYTVEKTQESLELVRRHLKKGGVGYVAGKRFYFGCGGGMGLFKELIDGEEFEWEVKEFDNGKSNVRDIVIMRRRK